MLWGITGKDAHFYANVFEDIWDFRHRHFVERFGWEAIRQPDGREIDDFDHDAAIHLPLLLNGKVMGYSRLLPTDRPHLLSDVYPEMMGGGQWSQGPTVYEWTRCVAEVGDHTIEGVPVSHMLMTGVMEYCLMAGISKLIVETHPKLVNLLITTGWDVVPLCAPTAIDGVPVLPIEAVPSPKGLLKHHELYGINGSVVDLEHCSTSPLGWEVEMGLLPYLEGPHVVETAQRLAGE
jgi:acyl-homoserine lactone synthase